MSTKKKTTKKPPSAKQLAARRKFAAAAKARVKTAKAKRNAVNIKAKRVTVLNVKRNPDYEILKEAKPVKKGSETGWQLGKQYFPKAKGQRKLPGGALLDLSSGFVYRKVENPARGTRSKYGYGSREATSSQRRKGIEGGKDKRWRALLFASLARKKGSDLDVKRAQEKREEKLYGESAKKRKNIAGFMQDGVFHPIRSGIEQRTTKAGVRRVKSKKAYKPTKVGEKTTYSAKKAAKRAAQSKRITAETKTRKATTSRLASRSLQRSVSLKPARRNPAVITVKGTGSKDAHAVLEARGYNIVSSWFDDNIIEKGGKYFKISHPVWQGANVRLIPIKKPTRRNPDATAQAKEQFKEFHGYAPGRSVDVYIPESAPTQGLSTLGEFYKFTFEGGGSVKPAVKVWLLRDLKGRLHLGGTKPGAVMSNEPAGYIGTIKRIEYIAAKPHLKEPNKIIWFHRAGEEGGAQPRLYSDGKGGLLIKGGDYYITPEGIRN